jgi:hypothetical protein
MAAEIDRALSALSEAGGGIAEFGQARRMIQAGIAKLLQTQGTPDVALSPTATGPQFPGPIGGAGGL